MSLLLCPQPGCNRKYKREATLLKHLASQHNVQQAQPLLDNLKKVPTKAEKEARTQQQREERQRREEQQREERQRREEQQREERQRREDEARRQRELEEQARAEAEAAYQERFREEHIQHIREMEALQIEQARQKMAAEQELQALKAQIEAERLEVMRRVRENPDNCAVCYDRASGGAAVVPCGHAYFCYPCLLNWKDNYQSRGCPYCRGSIKKIQKLIH
jgi:flagellar biosynthesis GTPase FlhF